MKKLESIKCEKFVVSEDQLLQIKGGYSSGNQSYSSTEADTSSYEQIDDCMPDRCVDW